MPVGMPRSTCCWSCVSRINQPYQVSTSWLVQVNSLELVAIGKEVPVRVDLKKPKRLIPNVPWARAWIFD